MLKRRGSVPKASPVRWLGFPIKDDGVSKEYSGCRFNDETYKKYDFALVVTGSKRDKYTACQICRLYKDAFNTVDCYLAEVTWFYRIDQMPRRYDESGIPRTGPLVYMYEVFEDSRMTEVVSIETFHSKCEVIAAGPYGLPLQGAAASLAALGDTVFHCRFRLAPPLGGSAGCHPTLRLYRQFVPPPPPPTLVSDALLGRRKSLRSSKALEEISDSPSKALEEISDSSSKALEEISDSLSSSQEEIAYALSKAVKRRASLELYDSSVVEARRNSLRSFKSFEGVENPTEGLEVVAKDSDEGKKSHEPILAVKDLEKTKTDAYVSLVRCVSLGKKDLPDVSSRWRSDGQCGSVDTSTVEVSLVEGRFKSLVLSDSSAGAERSESLRSGSARARGARRGSEESDAARGLQGAETPTEKQASREENPVGITVSASANADLTPFNRFQVRIERLADSSSAAASLMSNILSGVHHPVVSASRRLSVRLLQSAPDLAAFYRRSVALSRAAAVRLCADTVRQSGDAWHDARRLRITGSRCYGYYTHSRAVCQDWSRKLASIFRPSFFNNAAMRHGTENEGNARAAYARSRGVDVVQMGLIVNPEVPWLGYSPDGMVAEGGSAVRLIEIKCPVRGLEETAEAVFRGMAYYCKERGGLRKKHPYYGQMQMGMALTGLKHCDFVIYAPCDDSVFVEEIPFDEAFCDEMITAVTNVYFDIMLAYLVDKMCGEDDADDDDNDENHVDVNNVATLPTVPLGRTRSSCAF